MTRCGLSCYLQMRQAKAVAKHDGLRKRTARARVEAHLARMLAFDFEPGVKEWRRACAAQGWYWTRGQQADLSGRLPGPFGPIERDLGPTIAAVWALYESTFRDACVMDWTQAEATTELSARLQAISLSHKSGGVAAIMSTVPASNQGATRAELKDPGFPARYYVIEPRRAGPRGEAWSAIAIALAIRKAILAVNHFIPASGRVVTLATLSACFERDAIQPEAK